MSNRRATVPFADIVRDVIASPVQVEELRPGHYGEVFVDEDGQIYELVADDINSPSAQWLAAAGARVAWDA